MSAHVHSIYLGRAGTAESHKMSFGIVYTLRYREDKQWCEWDYMYAVMY